MCQFYRACLGLYVPPHLGGISVVDLLLNGDSNLAALNNECNAKEIIISRTSQKKFGGFEIQPCGNSQSK